MPTTRTERPNPLDQHHPNLFTTGTPLTAPDAQLMSGRSQNECVALAGDRPIAVVIAEPQRHECNAGFDAARSPFSRQMIESDRPLRRRCDRRRPRRTGVGFAVA